jgi:hypothetical protein
MENIMVALNKSEIIDQLKRIGVDNPSEISPCVKTYKKYQMSNNKSKKEFSIIKYLKLFQYYLL